MGHDAARLCTAQHRAVPCSVFTHSKQYQTIYVLLHSRCDPWLPVVELYGLEPMLKDLRWRIYQASTGKASRHRYHR